MFCFQLVHYHATTKTRTVRRQVAAVERPGIRPGGSDQWTGELLTVPPVPPSFLHGCGIIDIDYVVRVCYFLWSSYQVPWSEEIWKRFELDLKTFSPPIESWFTWKGQTLHHLFFQCLSSYWQLVDYRCKACISNQEHIHFYTHAWLALPPPPCVREIRGWSPGCHSWLLSLWN